jgi:sugar lactone lactonase YvrE
MKYLQLFLTVVASALLMALAGCSDADLLAPAEDADRGEDGLLSKWEVPKPAPGVVVPVLSLTPDNSVEGIAVDRLGQVYAGNRRVQGGIKVNEILLVEGDGSAVVFVTLPDSDPSDTGLLGLVTDAIGNVYAALVAADPAVNGVYRIGRQGTPVERLAGSEAIIFPNALTFDARGTLYCTSSFGSAVWRYGKDGVFSKLIEHPLLEAIPDPAVPIDMPGANGIVFYPPNNLYVANTSQHSILRITLDPAGAAAGIELVAAGYPMINPDGLAVDAHEYLYTVLPASTAEEIGAPPTLPPVLGVNPHTGEMTPVISDDTLFDTPTSLAFGSGYYQKSLYVANAQLFGPGLGAGPGIVHVGADTPGFPGH